MVPSRPIWIDPARSRRSSPVAASRSGAESRRAISTKPVTWISLRPPAAGQEEAEHREGRDDGREGRRHAGVPLEGAGTGAEGGEEDPRGGPSERRHSAEERRRDSGVADSRRERVVEPSGQREDLQASGEAGERPRGEERAGPKADVGETRRAGGARRLAHGAEREAEGRAREEEGRDGREAERDEHGRRGARAREERREKDGVREGAALRVVARRVAQRAPDEPRHARRRDEVEENRREDGRDLPPLRQPGRRGGLERSGQRRGEDDGRARGERKVGEERPDRGGRRRTGEELPFEADVQDAGPEGDDGGDGRQDEAGRPCGGLAGGGLRPEGAANEGREGVGGRSPGEQDEQGRGGDRAERDRDDGARPHAASPAMKRPSSARPVVAGRGGESAPR